MKFYPGLEVEFREDPLDIQYGKQVYGPTPELRTLDSIRKSLIDPNSKGPETVYCISMDVGLEQDKQNMLDRNLLFGVVTYAKGQIGEEPVRSQGHIHAISKSCSASTCEVYEIWDGEAYIYMQESGKDEAGRCIVVHALAGDVVIVPPGWVHATINADPERTMSFGAWCVRDYGFDYEDVRAHHGIAYFPIIKDGKIKWKMNKNYHSGHFVLKEARSYPELHIEKDKPIYSQFQEDPDRFLFVSKPQLVDWDAFEV